MYVNTITFESLYVESSFLVNQSINQSSGNIFTGYMSNSYMKVTGSKSRSQKQTARNSLSPQCETSMGNNSSCTEDRAVKFARSMGFSDTADRMV